jgi:Ricin-type beta-trefoil lectin domain
MTATRRLRRTLASVLVALAATTAAAGGLAATVGTAHATVESPGGELLNLGSGSCLAGDGSSSGFQPNPADPSQEEIYPCSSAQDWVPEPLSGLSNPTGAYKVVDGNGSCLGVKGGSLADGASVEWEPCGLSGDAQAWMALNARPADQYHSYELVNVNSGKCLGIYRAATAPGSLAVQWTCQASAANQRWNGDWFFGLPTNPASGQCIGVYGASTSAGAAVVNWGCQSDANQMWQIDSTDLSWRNSSDGMCLGVYQDSIGAYAVLVQEPCTGALAQRWAYKAYTSTEGTYVNGNSGMCLTEVATDTDLVQAPCTVTGVFSTPIPGQLWAWSQSNLGA